MKGSVRALLALVVVLAAVAVMLRLSLWQWDRAQTRHSWLNYTYAVEWLLFALLTVIGLARLVVEARRGTTRESHRGGASTLPAPGVPVPMVGPPLRPGEELEEITWVRLRRRLGLGGR